MASGDRGRVAGASALYAALVLIGSTPVTWAAVPAPAPGNGFQTGMSLPVSGPRAVVTADFNGDGKPDLAAVSFNSNSAVTVLLGNGGGVFAPGVNYPVGIFPDSLAAGDLNGDGKPDLVVANSQSASVSVLLGVGDGTFRKAVSFPVGSAPYGVAIVDLNRDGNADLVVGNSNDGTISVLLGKGDGSFQAATTVKLAGRPEYVAAGDFNGDGKADIAVVDDSPSGNLFVLLGRGDGTFQAPVTYPGLGSPRTVAIGDFNADGNADLITANQDSHNVSVFLGRGDGTFQPAVNSVAGPSAVFSVAVADFNGDSKLDAVVANFDTASASVLLGNGDGTFQAPVNFTSDMNPHTVVVADFNGDGRLDVAVGNLGANNIRILLGIGGQPSAMVLKTVPAGSAPLGTAVVLQASVSTLGLPPANVTGTVSFYDQGIPLGSATIASGTAQLSVRSLGAGGHSLRAVYSGNAVYGNPITSEEVATSLNVAFTVNASAGNGFAKTFIPSGGNNAMALAIGDFNGDGKADLALANRVSNSVTLFQGDGNGGFTPAGTLNGFSEPSGVVVGDFDRDGLLDVAVTNRASGTVSILLSNGNFTFKTPRTIVAGASPYAIAVADFNADGRTDLVVRSQSSSTLSVLLGNGNGTFQAATTTALEGGSYSSSMATGDFNSDGIGDVAIALNNSNQVAVLLGKGDGSFQPALNYPVLGQPQGVVRGDFNGDGIADLAVSSYAAATVSVLFGKGDGTFQAAVSYPAGVAGHTIVASDFNGDGKLDVAVAGWSNNVTVLLNKGDGTLLAPVTYTTSGEFPWAMVAADVNGDGRADLIASGDHAGNETPSPGDFGVYLAQAPPAVPASITASAGNGQSAVLNTSFLIPLQATVRDTAGNGMPGVSVTFSAPASGASGWWCATPIGTVCTAGARVVVATTDASGVATAGNFVATGAAGTYTVTANAGALSTTFTLTNSNPAQNFTVTPNPVAITLTAGTTSSLTLKTASGGTATSYSAFVRGTGNWLQFAVPQPAPTTETTATVWTTGTPLVLNFHTAGLQSGSYNSTIEFDPPAGGPVSVPVTLTVRAAAPNTPALVMPPVAGFDFTSANPPASITKKVTIDSPSGSPTQFTYSVTYPKAIPAQWLSVNPESLTTPAVVVLTAVPDGLPPGRYLAVVRATPTSGAAAAAALVAVIAVGAPYAPREKGGIAEASTSPLMIGDPRCIWMSADTPPPQDRSDEEKNLGCTYAQTKDPAMATQNVLGPALDFVASTTGLTNWLTATLNGTTLPADNVANAKPVAGTTTAPVTLQLAPNQLPDNRQVGFYSVIGSQSGDVAMVGAAMGPAISPSAHSLDLPSGSGTTGTTNVREHSVAEATAAFQPVSFTLTATGGTVPFTVTSTQPWLAMDPSTGTAVPGQPVTITVSPSGTPTAQGATVQITRLDDATKPPQYVSVTADNSTASPNAPVIRQVVNGATFQPPLIAPGTWVSIFGTGLSDNPTAVTWDNAVVNGRVPLSLGGVTVKINNLPAYISYLSPTQINAASPADTTQGPVSVTVTNNGRVSAAAVVPLGAFSPGIFQWGGTKYAIATTTDQSFPCAPTSRSFVGAHGNPSVPVHPGDLVTLWVTGLGPTVPPQVDGQLPVPALPVAAPVTVQMGTTTPTLISAAISGYVALYQVSFCVPADAPDGDVPIWVTVGGAKSPDGVFLSTHH